MVYLARFTPSRRGAGGLIAAVWEDGATVTETSAGRRDSHLSAEQLSALRLYLSQTPLLWEPRVNQYKEPAGVPDATYKIAIVHYGERAEAFLRFPNDGWHIREAGESLDERQLVTRYLAAFDLLERLLPLSATR
jgi:hypothetical protein